jgi:adenylate cyclase
MQPIEATTPVAGVLEALQDICGIRVSEGQGDALLRRLRRVLEPGRGDPQPIRETEVTILMADLRGFTSITESASPPVISDVLNRYFAAMVEEVHRGGGYIDKFMGDTVMALFGAPESQGNDLQRAVQSAVRMQWAMLEVNRESEQRGLPRLYAGIGINTGKVLAGSFGPPRHHEYTVIGDAVNLAARIEAYSLRGQILLSEATWRGVRGQVEIGRVNRVRVKGKVQPVALYELRRIRGPEPLEVPRVEMRRSPRIPVDLPLAFHLVADKRVLPESFFGRIRELGYFGMSAHLPLSLTPLSEILMTLAPQLVAEGQADLYAKVLRSRPEQGGFRTSLELTTIDTPAHEVVKRYVDQVLWGC